MTPNLVLLCLRTLYGTYPHVVTVMRTAQQQNSPADASTVTGNTAQITLWNGAAASGGSASTLSKGRGGLEPEREREGGHHVRPERE